MTVPANKEELLKAINSSFEKLINELRELPLSLMNEASLEGHAKGTLMSPSNLVAYLVGWNELVLKWLDCDEKGKPIDFPEIGFKWNQLGSLAQKFYKDYESIPYPELVEQLAKAKAEIVLAIDARSNENLYGRPWYGKWTMGRMIQFNTASPYTNGRGRLRKWLRTREV